MKILHVCSNYYPAHGGPQYTMKHLSEYLSANYGDHVQVATSNSYYGPEMPVFKKIVPATEKISDIEVHRFAFNRWHYPLLDYAGRGYKKIFKRTFPHSLYKYRWELDCRGINKMMASSDADVIMATTANYMFSDYPAWRFRTKNPKPFVLYGAVHLHINWPGNAPVIRRSRLCDCYIANTDYEKEKMTAYGVPAEKIVTTGTGINPAAYACNRRDVHVFRQTYQLKETDVLIGHIGRLSEGKGTAILLDAFAGIYKKNTNARLLLAGTSTDFVPQLKEKIRQLQLPVIILENFDNILKPLLFNAIDVLVLASRGESFGVVFLEAWACKKPVIGVDGGAVASLIEEGADGLLFRAGDVHGLIEKISLLVGDRELSHCLGEKGFEKVMQQYSWEAITKKYRDAYLLGMEQFKRKHTGKHIAV